MNEIMTEKMLNIDMVPTNMEITTSENLMEKIHSFHGTRKIIHKCIWPWQETTN